MYNEEAIKYLARIAMDEYPSISQPDAVRLAINLLKGFEYTKDTVVSQVCESLMNDYAWYNPS